MAEVRRRLLGAGYPEPLVEAAVARLLAAGYLDDLAFARAWVAARDRTRPRGALALRRELRLRGIDDAVVEAVLAEREAESGATAATEAADAAAGDRRSSVPVEGGAADAAAAQRLLDRRRAALSRIADPARRRARAYALLARAGFAPDLAADLARTVVADGDPAVDPLRRFGVD